jgi:hypothetical protein
MVHHELRIDLIVCLENNANVVELKMCGIYVYSIVTPKKEVYIYALKICICGIEAEQCLG